MNPVSLPALARGEDHDNSSLTVPRLWRTMALHERSSIVEVFLTDTKATPRTPQQKNPAAVSLGRLGGRKGGRARAEALSPEQRRQIAKKAAQARWSTHDER